MKQRNRLYPRDNRQGLKCQWTSFRSIGNMPRMQRSMNDVPSNKSTSRISTVSNPAHTRRSPMKMDENTMLSTFTTLWFSDSSCRHRIDLTDSFHAYSRNSLPIYFGPAPVLSNLITVNKGFDVACIKSWRDISLLEKRRHIMQTIFIVINVLSIWRRNLNNFFRTCAWQIFSWVNAAINVMPFLCTWGVLIESLCLVSETITSAGRSHGTKGTVLLPFAFSLSKAAVLQMT